MKHIYIFFILFFMVGSAVAQNDESWKVFDDSQVARVDITIHPDTLAWIYDHPDSDMEHIASARFVNKWIDQAFDSIGFRLRGNTSRQSAKKSFKISFNTFIKGRKLMGIEKLNLNGEHNDPSIARSKFCFDFWAETGMAASRANHTEVYINDDYYGLYVSVEHIDEEFLQKRFADDAGNLWKCLYPADLVYKGDDPSAYGTAYELKTNVLQNDFSQLIRLMKGLKLTPDNSLSDTLDKLLEVDEVLKYLAMNTLVGSWDDYRSLMNNYYLYHEPSTGRFHVVPYDYDNTFGIDWAGVDWSIADPYNYPKVVDGERPLSDRMLAVPEWRNLYTRILHFYITELIPFDKWHNHPDSLRAMLAPYAVNDVYRTLDYGFTMEDFNQSYGMLYNNQHVKKGIMQFVGDCMGSVWGQLSYVESDPVAWASESSVRYPAPGAEVTIESSCFYQPGVSVVDVETMVNGANSSFVHMEYSPLIGTKNMDDYYRWRGEIGGYAEGDVVEWRIRVTGSDGKVRSWPRSSWYRLDVASVPDGLVVNELLASNSTSFADPQGDYDDWVELFNPTDQPVLLTGCYATDDADDLTKYHITQPGVVVEPQGYQVIWCDDDANDAGVHTTFKLSADGEYFALVAPDGATVIDFVSFGPQQTDVSFGRLPNGGFDWSLMAPTPMATNQGLGSGADWLIGSFTLYPNPVSTGRATLRVGAQKDVNLSVNIYSLTGTCLNHFDLGYVPVGNSIHPLELVALKPGLYLVEIVLGENSDFRKLVIR